MSGGIGFAGLGKHLAERTLGLLSGKPQRSADADREDFRLTASNQTNYAQLIQWQQNKRKRSARIRLSIFVSVLIVTAVVLTFLFI